MFNIRIYLVTISIQNFTAYDWTVYLIGILKEWCMYAQLRLLICFSFLKIIIQNWMELGSKSELTFRNLGQRKFKRNPLTLCLALVAESLVTIALNLILSRWDWIFRRWSYKKKISLIFRYAVSIENKALLHRTRFIITIYKNFTPTVENKSICRCLIVLNIRYNNFTFNFLHLLQTLTSLSNRKGLVLYLPKSIVTLHTYSFSVWILNLFAYIDLIWRLIVHQKVTACVRGDTILCHKCAIRNWTILGVTVDKETTPTFCDNWIEIICVMIYVLIL